MHLVTALSVVLGTTAALPHADHHQNDLPLSLHMARSIMSRKQGVLTSSTDSSALLQAGFTQKAFSQVLVAYPISTVVPTIADYIIQSIDSVVPTVSNATRDISYPLDRLSSGNGLLQRYEETGNEMYKTAFEALRKSVDLQPKNEQGGLWYYTYPYWSYLDGMFSFAPFMGVYSTSEYDHYNASGEIDMAGLEHVVLQLDLLWQHCYLDSSGLLVHGYDASKTAVWANNVTGGSPHVWGRSLGWYCLALVDAWELLPESAIVTRKYISQRFQQLMPAVVEAVDQKTGAWWQVLDQAGRKGNYVESSASSMFVYSILKGVRLGLLGNHTNDTALDASVYEDVGKRAYEHVAGTFVVDQGNGTLGWNGTVGVCSLNSTASFEYYTGQPIVYNSVLGSAAFVLASLEYERLM